MKQTEQPSVTLNMTLSQAERIETEFVRVGPIALACRRIINEARTKEARAKEKAPDEALIPVTVSVTLTAAKIILRRYRGLGGPTDHAIYLLVKKAVETV